MKALQIRHLSASSVDRVIDTKLCKLSDTSAALVSTGKHTIRITLDRSVTHGLQI